MARKKMADGTEIEIPDTIITDAEPVVEAAPEEAPVAESLMTEQTLAEMAEGRRMLEVRAAEAEAARARRETLEAASEEKPAE